MTDDNNAERVVIDASDLAQLFLAAAEEARPGRPFMLLEPDLWKVLEEVGPERLPGNPRAHEPLVRVALALAHRAAGRIPAPDWWQAIADDVEAWKLETDAELARVKA